MLDITRMTTDGKGKYDVDQSYSWKHRSGKNLGWYDGSKVVEGITLKNGEGVSVCNNQSAPVQLRFTGAVNLTPVSMTVSPGYSLLGNMTPVPLALTAENISVCDADGKVIDIVGNSSMLDITKMTTDGLGRYDIDQSYSWKHRSGKDLGWYDGSKIVENVTIGAGEAFSVLNNQTVPVKLVFKCPIAK